MKKLLFVSFLCVMALSGCAKETASVPTEDKKEKTVISHSLGETEIPKDIKKIAVLEYGALDVIDALGEKDSVIGLPKETSLPSYLDGYKDEKYLNFGSLKEIDLEKLNASQPDLIIIGGRQFDYYDELKKIAPVLPINVDWEFTYMESVEKNLTTLGTIFNKTDEVNKYLADFNDRIDKINKKVKDSNYSAVVTIVSDRSMSALGLKSRCSLISNEMGFENLAKDLENSTHGNSISYEYLLENDPDYIFVLDRNLAVNKSEIEPAKEIVENELVKNTKAYKNSNIIYLTPQPWYLAEGGIYSTDLMISEIENAVK